MKNNAITEFRDKYRWLSNFWKVPIFLDDELIPYQSVENAYQASKTFNKVIRNTIRISTAGQAKKIGQDLGQDLRGDWSDTLRIETMRKLLHQKFDGRLPDLVQKLIQTQDAEIIEGNTWGDTFFGVCEGVGKNHLGKLLMEVRDLLHIEKDLIQKSLNYNQDLSYVERDLNMSRNVLIHKLISHGINGYTLKDLPCIESINWKRVLNYVQKNPNKIIQGFPFSMPFPKTYTGVSYKIILVNGKTIIATVDDSREFASEGLEWKTKEGNKEQSSVAAWKLHKRV